MEQMSQTSNGVVNYPLQPNADETHDFNRIVFYTLVDEVTGEVKQQGSGSFVPDLEGCVRLYVQAPSNTYWDHAKLQFVALPQRGNENETFDWSTKTWQDMRDLEQHKAAKWIEIKQARDAAEYGGFDVPGVGRFDSDAVSVGKITGAVTLAQLAPEAYTVDWTLADNSVVTLDAAGMAGVGIALGQHVAAVHATGRLLREQIEGSNSVRFVRRVLWPQSAG